MIIGYLKSCCDFEKSQAYQFWSSNMQINFPCPPTLKYRVALLNICITASNIYFSNNRSSISIHNTENQEEETSNINYKTTNFYMMREHWYIIMNWKSLAEVKLTAYIRRFTIHYICIIWQESALVGDCWRLQQFPIKKNI